MKLNETKSKDCRLFFPMTFEYVRMLLSPWHEITWWWDVSHSKLAQNLLQTTCTTCTTALKGPDVLAKRALDGRAHLQFQTVLTWLERYDMIWQGTVTEMTCVAVQCMYNVSIEYNWIDVFFGAVCAPKVSASPLALRSPVAVLTCRRFDVSQVLSGCFTFKFDVDSLGSSGSTFFRSQPFSPFSPFSALKFFWELKSLDFARNKTKQNETKPSKLWQVMARHSSKSAQLCEWTRPRRLAKFKRASLDSWWSKSRDWHHFPGFGEVAPQVSWGMWRPPGFRTRS